jgi:hypothetical protein
MLFDGRETLFKIHLERVNGDIIVNGQHPLAVQIDLTILAKCLKVTDSQMVWNRQVICWNSSRKPLLGY